MERCGRKSPPRRIKKSYVCKGAVYQDSAFAVDGFTHSYLRRQHSPPQWRSRFSGESESKLAQSSEFLVSAPGVEHRNEVAATDAAAPEAKEGAKSTAQIVGRKRPEPVGGDMGD